jgi:hypothetical protein
MPVATVPTSHQTLPAVPQTVNNQPSPGALQAVLDDARSRLKQKNCKGKILELEFGGLMLEFEAGTKFNCSGFLPAVDATDWILRIVEFRARGKGGSTTTLTLFQSTEQITSS